MPIEYLPARLKPAAHRFRDEMKTDAGAMIILGIIMTVRGASYWYLDEFVLLHPLDVMLPMWLTSGTWVGMGLVLIIGARWHACWVGRWSLSVAVAALVLWGTLFIFSPGAAFAQRGVPYIGLAVLAVWAVWKGRRGISQIKGVRSEHRGSGRR